MLFRQKFLDGIRDGIVNVAFRRWRRPSVRGGGTLLTPVGQLSIMSVSQISINEISEADARHAGYDSLDELLGELQIHTVGEVYRIDLGPLRPDPRVALRESITATDAELRDVRDRLQRLDSRSTEGPWTLRTLELIQRHPGIRAADLCVLLSQSKEQFKLNVRKLKALGLTESLETGYRLSTRGTAFMQQCN